MAAGVFEGGRGRRAGCAGVVLCTGALTPIEWGGRVLVQEAAGGFSGECEGPFAVCLRLMRERSAAGRGQPGGRGVPEGAPALWRPGTLHSLWRAFNAATPVGGWPWGWRKAPRCSSMTGTGDRPYAGWALGAVRIHHPAVFGGRVGVRAGITRYEGCPHGRRGVGVRIHWVLPEPAVGGVPAAGLPLSWGPSGRALPHVFGAAPASNLIGALSYRSAMDTTPGCRSPKCCARKSGSARALCPLYVPDGKELPCGTS